MAKLHPFTFRKHRFIMVYPENALQPSSAKHSQCCDSFFLASKVVSELVLGKITARWFQETGMNMPEANETWVAHGSATCNFQIRCRRSWDNMCHGRCVETTDHINSIAPETQEYLKHDTSLTWSAHPRAHHLPWWNEIWTGRKAWLADISSPRNMEKERDFVLSRLVWYINKFTSY